MTSTSEQSLKSKDTVELCKVNFSHQIEDGVNMYFYGCVSLLAPVCVLCLCVCDIKSEY